VADLLRLVRAPNLALAALGTLAGGWIALGAIATPKVVAFAALAAAALGAAGNAANDLADVPADRVNRGAARRPLAAGRVARGTAELCVVGGALAGLAAAGLVSGAAVVVGVAALAVLLAYSPLLKRRGLPGNLAVAALAGLPLFYGALAAGRPVAGLVPWALGAWIHLVRELAKDLEDEPGDRALGRRTLPIVYGRRRAAQLAAWLAVGFVPLSLALPALAGYGRAYFGIALAAQVAVGGVALRLWAGRPEHTSRFLKGAMVVGIAALVAGRVT
jgi:geranylgeranylglycerol-phosphate geranylgeranyltransferase